LRAEEGYEEEKLGKTIDYTTYLSVCKYMTIVTTEY